MSCISPYICMSTHPRCLEHLTSHQFEKKSMQPGSQSWPPSVTAVHAYFMSLKSVLVFQTLKPSMLGKQATNHKGKGKNCSWTLLPGSIWLKTPITPLHLRWKFESMFWSLKQFDDLWVYQGFVVPLNHQTGMQGTLKHNA